MKGKGGLNELFLLFLLGCTSNETTQNPEIVKITTDLGVSTQVQLGGSGVQADTSVQADATHSGSTHQSSQAVQ
ncbi:hypothetical protein AY606_15095 [Acinetobacter sp. SFB]|uniref:hypothetical protein n=1 Tax=Acinetobacter sp. SFB TaxID=1805634 RepID=UPI0007D811C4|nr:hypothetical protein [Acinetobacter sp. SFB]OAL80785.1 hypothetical protein AY606_15095 [Acinetobacter sp. SFB]